MYARSGKPQATLPPIGGQPSQPYQDTRYQQPPPPLENEASPAKRARVEGNQFDPNQTVMDPPEMNGQGGIRPGPNDTQAGQGGGNHALQDYQMQLMLLEQLNKKRLMAARQEQDLTHPSRLGRPVAEAIELNERRLNQHRGVEPPRLSDYVFRASPYASHDAAPQASQEPDLDAIPEEAELVNKLAQSQMKDGFQTLAYTPYPDDAARFFPDADATPLIPKADVPLDPPVPRGGPRYGPDEESLFRPDYELFDAPGALSGLVPPVPSVPMNTPGPNPKGIFPPPSASKGAPKTTDATTVSETQDPSHYDTTKPTCSLNLVCYRSGAKGCDLQQMQCVLQTMFPSEEAFQATITANKDLVHSDDEFFHEMQRLYRYKMCSFFRRYFSLKSLRAFRVLAYTPTTRPTVVPFDDFVLQEMMYAYQNPDRLSSSQDWILWVFRLRLKDRRHALEFVEGWNTTRIAISGAVPCVSSCLVGIIWTAMGGDVQSAFTVASFLLTISSIILALLAIISSIESSGGLSTSRY